MKIKVCIFVFDLLYLNGQPLVSETYRERECFPSHTVPLLTFQIMLQGFRTKDPARELQARARNIHVRHLPGQQ